jgi:hypothetical protein
VSVYFELRRGQLQHGGLDFTTAGAAAIEEVFIAIGLVILLVTPLALLLPVGQTIRQPQST